MTPSQIEIIDWYKSNSDWFDEIEKQDKLNSGEIRIETKTHIYLVGKRGGLTNTCIK